MCPMLLSAVNWVTLHLIISVYLHVKMPVGGKGNRTLIGKMYFYMFTSESDGFLSPSNLLCCHMNSNCTYSLSCTAATCGRNPVLHVYSKIVHNTIQCR